MKKDIYDSLIPKGIRDMLAIQDKLNIHQSIAEQVYNSHIQNNVYSGLSADIIEKSIYLIPLTTLLTTLIVQNQRLKALTLQQTKRWA